MVSENSLSNLIRFSKQEYCSRGHYLEETRVVQSGKSFCGVCNKETRKKRYLQNKQKYKTSKTSLYKRKLSYEEYITLLEKQSSLCLICYKPFVVTPCIDHDHVSGRTRGLLCRHCNWLVGQVEKYPDLLIRTTEYLRGYPR